jgi:hypothetical protein
MEGLFFISLTFDLDQVRAWKFVMQAGVVCKQP